MPKTLKNSTFSLTKNKEYGILNVMKCVKNKKGEKNMLDNEICKLREKLNNSILNGDDYSITYKLSVELDELIAQYYRESKAELKIGHGV